MNEYDSDFMTIALDMAPIDPRTGNKVIYNASWKATNNSMVGERNEDWVRRELDWFASGSNNLRNMEPPIPQAFQDCADSHGYVNSAYGHILFNHSIVDVNGQYDKALNAFLTEGLQTRHSVAVITDRMVSYLATFCGRHDFICTNVLNFMVDAENRLHIIAQMRSMDAVWGYRADYSMWDFVMDKMVADLQEQQFPGVTRGDIHFQVANLHVYPRHFDLLAKWAQKIYDEQERRARRQWMDREKRLLLEMEESAETDQEGKQA